MINHKFNGDFRSRIILKRDTRDICSITPLIAFKLSCNLSKRFAKQPFIRLSQKLFHIAIDLAHSLMSNATHISISLHP
jgi:hypothetical protein